MCSTNLRPPQKYFANTGERSTMNTIGFLGGGQMATAIAKGASKSSMGASTSQLVFCEPNSGQQKKLKELFPECTLCESAQQLFERCDRIVIAVKPQVLTEIATSLRPLIQPRHLLVSIVAGVAITKLSEWFGTSNIIRIMPNTPCQSGKGASGMAVATGVNQDDTAWCEALFNSLGITIRCTDDQLHAVTGVSGSGPAYVLMMIEALSDGGVKAGLSRTAALELATQTVLGAAAMVQDTKQHPAVLREQVTSPGGTTIAAIASLERNGFRHAVIDAVDSAVQRSRELGG
jgi:pyrroline-5-carboxylate reductase